MQQMQLSMGRTFKMPENVSLLQNPKMGRPHPRTKNLNGRVFGELTVIGMAGIIPCLPKGSLHVHWLAVCACGNYLMVRGADLIKGATSSCECTKAEKCRQANLKHGHKTRERCSPEYKVYIEAKGRCRNPSNDAYHNYGGRGIEFRFESFEAFLDEIGERPNSTYSLDRIDNNGHYEKGNLRWATRKEQMNNQRKTRYLTMNGVTQCLTTWAESSILKYTTIKDRLHNGWCDECSLTQPLKGHCVHKNDKYWEAVPEQTRLF